MTLEELPGWARELVARERVARLGLLDDDGHPRVLPITFAILDGAVWSAIDRKPKRSQAPPARVGFLTRRPQSTVTIDHYEEDWDRLAWVQLLGRTAVVDAAANQPAMQALSERYPQYRDQPPPGPLLRMTPDRVLAWRAASGAGRAGAG